MNGGHLLPKLKHGRESLLERLRGGRHLKGGIGPQLSLGRGPYMSRSQYFHNLCTRSFSIIGGRVL